MYDLLPSDLEEEIQLLSLKHKTDRWSSNDELIAVEKNAEINANYVRRSWILHFHMMNLSVN